MSLNSDNSTARDKLESREFTPIAEPRSFSQTISKRPIPLLLFLLAIWIIGSTWLYWTYCCGSTGSLLSIHDGETTVAAASENIKFMEGSAEPMMAGHVEASLKKASDYVAAHPDKVLMISGFYNKDEAETNLGQQRADQVKAYMKDWNINPDYILTGGAASDIKSRRDTVYGGVNFEVKTIPNRYLSLKSGDFSVEAPDNLTFAKGKAEIGEPVPESVKASAQQVAAFLKANPDQQLRIQGWTGSNEKYEYLDNIGNERAKSLRNWWISMGVPANQVVVLPIPNDEKQDLIFIGDKVFGGANYELGTTPTEMDQATAANNTNGDNNGSNTANADGSDDDESAKKDASEALAKAPKFITIYFDYDSHVAKISDSDREVLATYIKYLNENKDKTVTLAGYTDDVGSIQYNLALSNRRAKNIQGYLKDQGVSISQMIVEGKGIAKPSSTDNIEEARAKSRKVELSVN